MTAGFSLHPKLEADTLPLTEWPLCKALLMNNACFPWVILVPKREGLREVTDLAPHERHALMDEISQACDALRRACAPDKLNVAALGNQVPQLHVHVIARFIGDAAWPQPVWGGAARAYGKDEAENTLLTLKRAFGG